MLKKWIILEDMKFYAFWLENQKKFPNNACLRLVMLGFSVEVLQFPPRGQRLLQLLGILNIESLIGSVVKVFIIKSQVIFSVSTLRGIRWAS